MASPRGRGLSFARRRQAALPGERGAALLNHAAELNARFGIAGTLTFNNGPAGLVMVQMSNRAAEAELLLQGAQVLRWAPRGEGAVLWQSGSARFSKGKPVRGGVPLCWPWFGSHPQRPDFPAHGFARNCSWAVVGCEASSDAQTRLTLRLAPDPATQRWWPHRTALEFRITIGAALELELVTFNTDRVAVTISEALHAYFRVGAISRARVLGLEDAEYLDQIEGRRRLTQSGPISVGAELDRIYVNSPGPCLIMDPVLERRILIEKRGGASTVVWNPWIEKAARLGDMDPQGYREMLCVESGNIADNTVEIRPGDEHRLYAAYRVERDS